jgi:hypothetical protein
LCAAGGLGSAPLLNILANMALASSFDLTYQ